MDSFFRSVSFPTLLTALFLPAFAGAADSTLDLSAGCKLYRLENRAWVPTDPAAKDGSAIPGSSVLKDAPFFVFRDASGTYGVSKKCVKASAARTAVVPRAQPARKRTSAAKPPAAVERKNPWSVAFAFGMNLSPKATVDTTSSIDGVSTASQKYKSSLGFLGEASYRSSSLLRYNVETGLSQLSDSDGNGNETSHIAIRPDLVFSVGGTSELYVGPILGLFFFSQNAQTVSDASGSATIKQQTPSALLLGAKLGYDFALSEQFDLGAFLEYFKPGNFKVHADITSPVAGTVDYSVKASWMFLGARFVIHF